MVRGVQQAELLIALPSGAALPLLAQLGAPVSELKEALRRQCGWPLECLPSMGLALGHSALREDLSLASNDVAAEVTLTVFFRISEPCDAFAFAASLRGQPPGMYWLC